MSDSMKAESRRLVRDLLKDSRAVAIPAVRDAAFHIAALQAQINALETGLSRQNERQSERRTDAKRALEMGNKWPYEAPKGWVRSDGPPLPPKDWAHSAARGVLFDLNDRRDIKREFATVNADIRREIVETLADIIRTARDMDPAE